MRLFSGIIFIIIANFFSIVPAVAVRYSFDLLNDSYNLYAFFDGFSIQGFSYGFLVSSIVIVSVIILSSAFLKGIFLFFMRQTIIVMSRLIEFDLKNEIYAHYQTLPLSFYRKNKTGDLIVRVSEDVSKVRMYLGPGLMYGINLFTLFCMVIPFMFSINPTLTFYSLLPLPILSVAIYFVSNIINKQSEIIQKNLSGLSSFVQESFSGIRIIKAFVQEIYMKEVFSKKSIEYKNQALKLTMVQSIFMPLIMGLMGLSVVLTVYVGALQVFEGSITTGNIAEFIIYVNMLTWPVTALGWITSIIQSASSSQKRINEFLKTKTDIITNENAVDKPIKGHIVFKNVSFVYPDSGIRALDNVSFEVSSGECLTIVGSTGSGKSTIANLICKLYNTSEGEILIDNKNINDYTLESLRKQIGYVPQDVFLFSETIRNNISFGSENMTDDTIEKAVKAADLKKTIDELRLGYENRIGERGIMLSGGQKQRISIARAIAGNPQLLIFDDCLSSVDAKTEHTILNALEDIMKEKTSLIISHRASSARLASKIIVLDKGKVIEYGNHESLMKISNGVYRELYTKQLLSNE